MNRKPLKTHWPAATFAPLGGPAVRIIARADDCQVRLTFMASLDALELRLFRKSPAEADQLEAYAPTAAGLVIPRAQLREFAGILAEVIEELES